MIPLVNRMMVVVSVAFVAIGQVQESRPRESRLIRDGGSYLGYFVPSTNRFILCEREVVPVVRPPDQIVSTSDRCENGPTKIASVWGIVTDLNASKGTLTISQPRGSVATLNLPPDSVLSFSHAISGDTIVITTAVFPDTVIVAEIRPQTRNQFITAARRPDIRLEM
jgi:hypothetical protein